MTSGSASTNNSTRESGTRRRRRAATATTSSPEEERVLKEIDASILDVFADAYCNKHLLYGMLELVIARLMPELTERGISELWEERLG
jgi:hypothetical protein